MTKNKWKKISVSQTELSPIYIVKDLDIEFEWFESKLSSFLNIHAKITQITAYFKRWWNEVVAKARKT